MRFQRAMRTVLGTGLGAIPVVFWPRIWLLWLENLSKFEFKDNRLICVKEANEAGQTGRMTKSLAPSHGQWESTADSPSTTVTRLHGTGPIMEDINGWPRDYISQPSSGRKDVYGNGTGRQQREHSFIPFSPPAGWHPDKVVKARRTTLGTTQKRAWGEKGTGSPTVACRP